MAAGFRFAPGRDVWERQTGERAEEHDWFLHWLNDGHRRTYVRTAERFEVSRDRVTGAAKRNIWSERLAGFKAHQSEQIRERFDDLTEQGLVPFAQSMARLAAHAASADLAKVPADRALLAAATALRVIKEPDVRDLIRLADANAAAAREFDVAGLILDQLAEHFPEAHDAVLDALGEATQQAGSPDRTG